MTPALGFHARVRGPAGENGADRDEPLALRHDVAVLASRLEHERNVALLGDLGDGRTRERRPSLLIWIADERHDAERVLAGPPQGVDGSHAGQEPGLRVGDAGPVRAVAIDSERPFRHRPLRPHRVHVADQHDAVTPAAPDPRDEDVAEPLPAFTAGVAPPFDLPA